MIYTKKNTILVSRTLLAIISEIGKKLMCECSIVSARLVIMDMKVVARNNGVFFRGHYIAKKGSLDNLNMRKIRYGINQYLLSQETLRVVVGQ